MNRKLVGGFVECKSQGQGQTINRKLLHSCSFVIQAFLAVFSLNLICIVQLLYRSDYLLSNIHPWYINYSSYQYITLHEISAI